MFKKRCKEKEVSKVEVEVKEVLAHAYNEETGEGRYLVRWKTDDDGTPYRDGEEEEDWLLPDDLDSCGEELAYFHEKSRKPLAESERRFLQN